MGRKTKRNSVRKGKAPADAWLPSIRDYETRPGLNPSKFSKIKQEYHDLDYLDKLNEKELDFLNSFMEEDLGGRLNHPNKKIYKKKKDKLECYRRNNQRNRDVYSLRRASGTLDYKKTDEYIEELQQKYTENINYEDELIKKIDSKKSKKTE